MAIGRIVAIGIPNDPFTLGGYREKGIAIEWIHWIHYDGSNGRQWRSPLVPMAIGTTIGTTDLIAIGANRTSVAKRKACLQPEKKRGFQIPCNFKLKISIFRL